jgi:molybdopterin converting factor small subunit
MSSLVLPAVTALEQTPALMREVDAVLAAHAGQPLQIDATALESSAPDIRAMLLDLEERFPDLYRGVCEETGVVRRHLNLFVNASHIRDLDGLATALEPGDEVMILPAVSGG